MNLTDSHCHIHNRGYYPDTTPEEILARGVANNVPRAVVIGTSHEDSLVARDFAKEYNNAEHPAYWTYGVHPSEFEKPRSETVRFEAAEDNPEVGDVAGTRPLAIGEVGLDYHYGPEDYDGLPLSFEEIKARQFRLLEEMLDLAMRNDLPVSFHVREAFVDFFAIFDNFHGVRGVVHSFTDNKKNLARVLERDLYVGVNGLATYSTLPLPPLERTLLETDAPYLAPVPHRGERNEPAYVRDVAAWLAAQHGMSIEEVAEQTEKNFAELFRV